MISFRFYVVSVTAFFLALTIGILMGSTFVDRAIVDNLQHRITSVSDNLDARKRTNDQLEAEARRVGRYVDDTARFAVDGRLADTDLLVVAQRGIDGDQVRAVVLLAQQAGAIAPGVLWIEPRWVLPTDGDRDSLRQAIGSPAASRNRLRDRAWAALAAELVGAGTGRGPSSTTTSTTSPGPTLPAPTTSAPASTTTPTGTVAPASVLPELVKQKFFTFDPVGGATTQLSAVLGTRPHVLVLAGSKGDAGLTPFLSRMVGHVVGAGLPTVAGELFVVADNSAGRGDLLARVVTGDLRARVSTVDNVDLARGRVTAVLAVADLDVHGTGHYGESSGAERDVPQWFPP